MNTIPASFDEPRYTYLKEGDVVAVGDEWEFRPGLWERQDTAGHVISQWEAERKRYRRRVESNACIQKVPVTV